MVVDLEINLAKALEKIGEHEVITFEVGFTQRNLGNADDLIDNYGKIKWDIVKKLNDRYRRNHRLEHWLDDHYDEVSYFLNEAGSNSLTHSEFKTPSCFHLFMGERGFIIGIEQEGLAFNPGEFLQQEKLQGGAGFEFFRTSDAVIFFNDPTKARVVYLLVTV